jgi:hypothetical protein
MYRVVIIITLFVFLLSCESNKTASYYAEHPKEMEAKMRECKEDAAKMMKDPDCINAAEGWNIHFWGMTKKDNDKQHLSKEKDNKKLKTLKQTKRNNGSKGLLLLE